MVITINIVSCFFNNLNMNEAIGGAIQFRGDFFDTVTVSDCNFTNITVFFFFFINFFFFICFVVFLGWTRWCYVCQ
jgi:hypothetical protein